MDEATRGRKKLGRKKTKPREWTRRGSERNRRDTKRKAREKT